MDDERPSLPTDEPLDGFIYVGEAIDWIASLGRHLFTEEIVERWDAAERKVLDALGEGRIFSEGYGSSNNIYSPIPAGVWPRAGGMDHDLHPRRPFFSSVDVSIGSECGGVLTTSDREWHGIRVKKADAVRLWSEELRDDLIEFCRQARLTPKEAHAWAQELKLRPLPARPDPQALDPSREPIWSLGMALAWIRTRSVDGVRELWEAWREAREMWVADQAPEIGWQLKSKADSSPLFDLTQLQFHASDAPSLRNAEDELWRCLQAGQLIATGLPSEGGIRQEIPRYRWRDLNVFEVQRKLVVKDSALGKSGYADIAFDSAKVRKLWKSRAVRPTKYDWVSFEAEVIRRLNDEGNINPAIDPSWTQAHLEREMSQWCSDEWGRWPAESTIRDKVKHARNRFLEGR